MKNGEGLAALLFRAVCLGFSTALLILALFSQIRCVRTESRIAALSEALTAAENENTRLRIRQQSALQLDVLERVATQKLGMRRPEPGQIVEIEYLG
ncbi:MAG: cell division protein FtsL [Oscillospiraceae bacterium]|nr:cell division protein FtsL [Oscillospiraceae bacterium]